MKSKINICIKTLLVAFAFVAVVPSTAAFAAPASGTSKCTGSFIFPAWYQGLDCIDGVPQGPSTKGAKTAEDTATGLSAWIVIIALNLVQMLLYIVGYVSLGFIIYGGFLYMTQGDNASGTTAARKTIQNAVIGLIISIMSVAIVKFVAGVI